MTGLLLGSWQIKVESSYYLKHGRGLKPGNLTSQTAIKPSRITLFNSSKLMWLKQP